MIGDAEIETLHLARDVQEIFEGFKYVTPRVSVENGCIGVELSNGRSARVEEPAVIDQTTALTIARKLLRQLQS